MTIREANQDEYKKLQQLNQEVMEDNYKYDSDLEMSWTFSDLGEKYFKNLIADESSTCFVAEENTVLIGYASVRLKSFEYRKSTYIEIGDLGVSPAYRSKGIGAQLVKACEKWGKVQGVSRIFVTSYFANQGAVKFYKKYGFTEIDVSLEKDIK